MAEIKLGPAGTPGKSTLEGISKVRELGLQAMEVEFVHGIMMKNELAKKIGEEVKKHKISLSVHAPFFINLNSAEPEKIDASKKRILDSCERGHYMGARKIVFHPAFYGKVSPEKTFEITKTHILDLQKTIKKEGWKVDLAPETTGKTSVFGSLDETIRLVKETGCSICVDFAHLWARNRGRLS
ncbi:MAG: TIM barrel protein [Deltaproteobacteria bacterium]|nr:TIM barrel protein [Deltaproteobacteria bacterium]